MNAYALIFIVGAVLLVIENLRPGRPLPKPQGWYARAAVLNSVQFGVVVLGGYTWSVWLHGPSLLRIDGELPAIVQGLICWLQRPEHHSIHHQTDVHHYNYGDITWWDRLFGTFREADGVAANCGYDGDREQRLAEMLAFRDVNRTSSGRPTR